MAARARRVVLTLGLGEAPLRVEEVHLDAMEVVLRLRVYHAEHRIRVGRAVNVGDAPIISLDRDPIGLGFPQRYFWVLG